MYEKPRVNVKVERGFYLYFFYFTHVKPVKVYVRTHVKITRQWKSTLTVVIGLTSGLPRSIEIQTGMSIMRVKLAQNFIVNSKEIIKTRRVIVRYFY